MMIIEQKKLCKLCGTVKPLDAFYVSRKSARGQPWCKPCWNKRAAAKKKERRSKFGPWPLKKVRTATPGPSLSGLPKSPHDRAAHIRRIRFKSGPDIGKVKKEIEIKRLAIRGGSQMAIINKAMP
jgi:hypothetical protein